MPGSPGAPVGGVAKRGYSNGQRYVFDGFLNYDRAWDTRHVLSLTGGTSIEQDRRDNNFVRGETLTDEKLHQVSNATNVTQFSGTFAENGLVSFFGRANYTLDEKYLLGLSFRSDGASVFGPNNRYGFFPGGSRGLGGQPGGVPGQQPHGEPAQAPHQPGPYRQSGARRLSVSEHLLHRQLRQ